MAIYRLGTSLREVRRYVERDQDHGGPVGFCNDAIEDAGLQLDRRRSMVPDRMWDAFLAIRDSATGAQKLREEGRYLLGLIQDGPGDPKEHNLEGMLYVEGEPDRRLEPGEAFSIVRMGAWVRRGSTLMEQHPVLAAMTRQAFITGSYWGRADTVIPVEGSTTVQWLKPLAGMPLEHPMAGMQHYLHLAAIADSMPPEQVMLAQSSIARTVGRTGSNY